MIPRRRWTVALVWNDGRPPELFRTTPPASGRAPCYFSERFWRRGSAERWARYCQDVLDNTWHSVGGRHELPYRYEAREFEPERWQR